MQDDHIDRNHEVSVHFLHSPVYEKEKEKKKGRIYGGTRHPSRWRDRRTATA
jgi:hypothetical protein